MDIEAYFWSKQKKIRSMKKLVGALLSAASLLDVNMTISPDRYICTKNTKEYKKYKRIQKNTKEYKKYKKI